MKPVSTIKWVIIFILVVLISTAMRGQDSVALKILSRPVTIGDTTYYHVRINFMSGSERVIVACCCKDKTIRKKGELVMVARKDLKFKKE